MTTRTGQGGEGARPLVGLENTTPSCWVACRHDGLNP
jgi:hypothetical protein